MKLLLTSCFINQAAQVAFALICRASLVVLFVPVLKGCLGHTIEIADKKISCRKILVSALTLFVLAYLPILFESIESLAMFIMIIIIYLLAIIAPNVQACIH